MPESMASKPPSLQWALARLVLMSWAWNFLVDFLWIPLLAYREDLGYNSSVVAVLFAVNLGARILPNVAVTVMGIFSEFLMMAFVLLGYLTALCFPTDFWALHVMALCSGMGFVRACLTLHPRMVFADAAELARAAKYCGSARNFGTLSALVLPVAVYELFGWTGVCLVAIATVLLYSALSLTQHLLFGASAAALPEIESSRDDKQTKRAIPWILWVMGAAFVVLELQMNICNAAVPMALTQTFGLKITAAGHFMALTNGASMVFLAWLPSAPRCMAVLHRSPMNILFAFFGIFAAWCLTIIATVYPHLGIAFFAPGVVVFMLAAYLAQCLMLECLTGIMDLEGSKLLMAISEIFGCGFAALGGYLGDELEVYGAAAPFALQALTSLLTASVLTLALGHRLVTQMAARRKGEVSESWLLQSITGLQAMNENCESFVDAEREYLRRQRSASLGESLLEEGASSGSEPEAASDVESPCREEN